MKNVQLQPNDLNPYDLSAVARVLQNNAGPQASLPVPDPYSLDRPRSQRELPAEDEGRSLRD